MNILVIAIHNNIELNSVTYNLLSAAKELINFDNKDKKITILVAGHKCEKVAADIAISANVEKVLLVDSLKLQHNMAEDMAILLQDLVKEYNFDYLIFPHNTFGKNIAPRIAAKLEVEQVSDILSIVNERTFKRGIYAGNIIATVENLSTVQVLTLRTTHFAANKEKTTPAPITKIEYNNDHDNGAQFIQNIMDTEEIDLSSARIVVSGGRGVQSAENFELIKELAHLLNAAVGASRAAVDANFIANEHQVGQTGKVVAPDLYIAIGISGAIQHIAGMKDSKIIVAINKDANAAIFKYADYGLIGDLNEIVPIFCQQLEKLNFNKD